MGEKVTDLVSGKKETAEQTNTKAEGIAPKDQQTKEEKATSVITEDPSALFSDALNEQTINKVADGKEFDIVVLVGFEEYGKSTFASSLYYCFTTNEQFCEHVMYDSDSYSGFERRLLIRSMKTNPSIMDKRTIKGEDPLLTMALYSEKTGKYKVVVSDRSGEDYSNFTGTDEEVKDNQILTVADHVLFFIDCEKMINNYGKLRYSYQNLLQEFAKHHLIPENASIKLVFNKFDLMKAHEDYTSKKEQTIGVFKTCLGDREYDIHEIDSRGVSDKFASVSKLTKCILLEVESSGIVKRETLDWVKGELNV